MGKRIKFSGLVVVLFFLGLVTCVYSQQENVTITTYYPSPSGSYKDLDVINKLRVGPFSMFGAAASNPGSLVLSGSSAGLFMVDRTLATYPGGAGNSFAWYNSGGIVRLWTPVNGDILSVPSNGQMNFVSRFDNSDANPGATFRDSNGWGTVTMGNAIFCN